jgi:hypothetical protein
MAVQIVLVPGNDLPSNQPSDTEIAATAAALTAWIDSDVAPPYSQGWGGHYLCTSLKRGAPVPPPSPHTWLCHLTAESAVPGALGYHTRDVDGNPVLFVAVQASIQAGRAWSLVASHEVVETLVNRFVDGGVLASYGSGQAFYFCEAADPVEGQPGYFSHHAGVDYAMSNFVLPSYFVPNAPGPYDHGGYVHAPLTPAPGGRQAVFPVGVSISLGGDGKAEAALLAETALHLGNRV